MKLDYVKKQRGLPFVKIGMRVELVTANITKQGKITGGNESGNINVKFDGARHSENCHPKWNMRYFDKDGKLLAEFLESTIV